jgi:ParB-like chromosome segregation protein Spo0J
MADALSYSESLDGLSVDYVAVVEACDRLQVVKRLAGDIASSDRNAAIFCARIEGAKLQELADEHGMTKECVRQIVGKIARRMSARLVHHKAIPRKPVQTPAHPTVAPQVFRQVEYIQVDQPVSGLALQVGSCFASLEAAAAAVRAGIAAAQIDGVWVQTGSFLGIFTDPRHTSLFDGASHVIGFMHAGARFGEDWRKLRGWMQTRRASFAYASKALH